MFHTNLSNFQYIITDSSLQYKLNTERQVVDEKVSSARHCKNKTNDQT
jgi:hypothetical protein